MPAATGGNDFFLQFGSNAEEFGKKLGTQLDAPISKIEALRKALAEYDAQVKQSSGKGPLADQFAGLNEAATRMQSAADHLVRGFAGSLNALQAKITGLAEILQSAGRVLPTGTTAAPQGRGPYTPVAGLAEPAPPVATQAQRKKVTEAELAAAKAEQEAVTKLAANNAKLAAQSGKMVDSIAGVLDALDELAGKLNAAAPKAMKATAPTTETQVSGEVQIGNSPSNPVPVIVVGGEPHGGSAPKGPTRATTATSNAAAVEALAPIPGVRSGEQWDSLNPRYRARLERAGITRSDYIAGASIAGARGHDAEAARLNREAQAAASIPTNAAAAAALGSENEPQVRAPKLPPSLTISGRAVGAGTANQLAALDESTRTYLAEVRAKLAALAGAVGPEVEAQKRQLIAEAGAVFKADSQLRPGKGFNRELFGSAPVRSAFLGDALGLDVTNPKIEQYLRNQVLRAGRTADQAAGVVGGRTGNKGGDPAAEAKLAESEALSKSRIDQILATTSGKLQQALLGQARALQALNRLQLTGEASSEQLAQAYVNLSRASEQVDEAEKGRVDRFATGLGKTGGWALRHTIAYTLVFTGYEKLKEVVHTGLEAQASMIRLQASLDATGKSSEGVADEMTKISASTGTPIQHVIDAASELAGVFKKTGELEFATNIAAQLSNISQGVLNTTEAAVGLRDLIAAFNITDKGGLQAIGDLIAHLSQITGVNVQDITKGTTQLAQEAKDFGLSPRQTATLAAYVTQGTGEPGEAAAEQVSRLLSTLYSGRVQTSLVKSGVTSQSKFLNGDIAGVLEDLISKYDKLNPATRQNLAYLIGSGRQARAFAALTSGGSNFVKEFSGQNPSQDAGALGRQNAAFMQTLLGQLHRLSEDFQNLGVSIQRSGLLDLLGALVTVLDKVAHFTGIVLGAFSDLADKTKFAHDLTHLGVALLEIYGIVRLLSKTDIGAGIGAKVRALPGRAAAFARGETYAADTSATAANTSVEQQRLAVQEAMLRVEQELLTVREREVAVIGEDIAATNADLRAKLADAKATEEEILVKEEEIATGGGGGRSGRSRLLGFGAGAGLFIGGELAGEALKKHGHETLGSIASDAGTGALIGSFTPLGPLGGAAIGAAVGFISSLNEPSKTEKDFAAGLKKTSNAREDFKSIAKGGVEGSGATTLGVIHAYLDDTKLTEKAKKAGVTQDELTKAIRGSNKAFDEVVAKWKAGGNPYEGTIVVLDLLRKAYQDSGAAAVTMAEKVAQSHNVLNQAQATLAQNYAGSVSGLTPQTLRAYPDALKALLSNSGTIIGTPAYSAAANLAGFNVVNPTQQQLAGYKERKSQYAAASKSYQDYTSEVSSIGKDKGALGDLPAKVRDDILAKADAKYAKAYHDALKLDNLVDTSHSDKVEKQANDYVANLIAQYRTGRTSAPGLPNAPIAPTAHLVRAEISPAQQARALASLLAPAIKTQTSVVAGIDPTTGKGRAYSPEQIAAAQTSLQSLLAQVQQAKDQVHQIPIQLAASRAQAATNLGNFQGATNALRQQKAALQSYLSTLRPNQAEYWSTMDQIFQVEQQIVTSASSPLLQKLQIQAANSLNPSAAAEAQVKIAQIHLEDARKAAKQEFDDASRVLQAAQDALDRFYLEIGDLWTVNDITQLNRLIANRDKAKAILKNLHALFGNTPGEQSAKQDLAGAQASQAQTAEAIAEARAQAEIAGIRNSVASARAQVAEAARQAAVYASQGDTARYYQAIAQEKQAEIALRDAIEGQRDALIKSQSSLLGTLKGDAVGAAQKDLHAAQVAYDYAVHEYGKQSDQAYQALSQLYQAQNAFLSAELQRQNASIELHISKLNFRGGLGDAERVARLQVQEAKNALASYLHKGGRKGTAEYDQLSGAIVSAQRNAIDVAINAQIDTLDFQRETYKITSSQEVQALQEILKNKQLTLAEQRSITLKIKDLQESIRQQLTEGGLNIPSDIKLPTAYEVRRSLGAGFSGSSTQVNTVNNNNQQVNIQNQVTSAAQVTQIVNQVINAINTQTNQQLRANSSTPRLVPTR